jgi:hypothetical protein
LPLADCSHVASEQLAILLHREAALRGLRQRDRPGDVPLRRLD